MIIFVYNIIINAHTITGTNFMFDTYFTVHLMISLNTTFTTHDEPYEFTSKTIQT